jgi:hypothetical protein
VRVQAAHPAINGRDSCHVRGPDGSNLVAPIWSPNSALRQQAALVLADDYDLDGAAVKKAVVLMRRAMMAATPAHDPIVIQVG